MIDRLEDELRRLFAEEADRAPTGPVARPGRRGSDRSRLLRGVGVLAAAGAVGVTVVLGGVLSTPHGPQVPRPGEVPVATPSAGGATAGPQDVVRATDGPVPRPGTADCVRFTPALMVRSTAFAFDGTVSAVGAERDNGSWVFGRVVATTFLVHTWFRGGTAPTVTVDVPVSDGSGRPGRPEPRRFGVGSRLLVSGDPSGAGRLPTAWGCGFTRYYDPASARRWRAATG